MQAANSQKQIRSQDRARRVSTMKYGFAPLVLVSVVAFVNPSTTIAQTRNAPEPPPDNRPFNARDLSGIWTRNGTEAGYGGGGTCRYCGDRGYSHEFPVLTAEGQKRLE